MAPTGRRAVGSFAIRRIYEGPGSTGDHRVLVDRLWPRGVRRDEAALSEWCRDVAPSDELRRWYGHDPAKFDEFARRYLAELARPPASDEVARLRALGEGSSVVLVTATKDVAHSGATVLRGLLLTGAQRGHWS
jgi:uncharacterized protein YeaO (DUF488 family)